ncbi:MAG: hypothetical protein R2697_18160 [Ilumatobacteraceae bacterium]
MAAPLPTVAWPPLSLGDQHLVGPDVGYFQNTPALGRLLAEWSPTGRPAGCLFLLPMWSPVLVAEQVEDTRCAARRPVRRPDRHRRFARTVRGARRRRRPRVGVRGAGAHRAGPSRR